MKKFIRQIDFNVTAKIVTEPRNTLKSVAQPDKSYSIKDILARSIAGALPPIAKAQEFTGDNVVSRSIDRTNLDAALNVYKQKTITAREKAKQELNEKINKQKEVEKAQIIADYEKSKQESQEQ